MPSSVIRCFDYDPRAQALDVEFISGRRYRYRAVPTEVAEAFRRAFAKGRFFNARIRDAYECEELFTEPAGDLWDL
jgi:lysyl-tRNA synthetase class 2